ncbi:MAG: hypothetical protein ACRCWI_02475 [Brevinema sp.]
MISILQSKVVKHPYIILLFCSFYFFFLMIFYQIHFGWIGDLYIYIEIAQNIYSGGILYQSAIDTKNIGFFFFFYYLIYLPYALIFSNMEYFFHWMAISLSIWYFLTSILIYQILLPIYNKSLALLSACLYFIFMAANPYSYFVNQPQIALFFHLLLIYVIMQKKDTIPRYFLYGWILGLCFSMSSPYAFLVLTIPIIAFVSYLQDKKFIPILYKGGVAFLGFLIALLPFILYLLKTHSIVDWLYWNFTFPTNIYSSYKSTYSDPMPLNFFAKFKSALLSTLGKSIVLSSKTVDTVTQHLMLYTVCFAWIFKLIQKKQGAVLSLQEKILLGISALCLIPRLGLVRRYPSYNMYIIPLVILHIPFVWNTLSSHPLLKKIYKSILIISIGVAIVYVPIRLSDKGAIVYYADPIKELTLANPDKKPTVMLTQWAGYTYSTRWQHVYHNFYHHFDDSFQQNVYKYKPEILFIRQFIIDNQLSKDNDFMDILNTQYTKIFSDNLTQEGGAVNIFIQNDQLHTWDNLPIYLEN